MTTAPYWKLRRRDLHPLAQQLASLRHSLAVYASLPPITRRQARLATGLPATALAGLDFHQLDSFRKVSSTHIKFPFPKLCLARYIAYPPPDVSPLLALPARPFSDAVVYSVCHRALESGPPQFGSPVPPSLIKGAE